MTDPQARCHCKYATLRYSSGAEGDAEVPVGVVLWSAEDNRLQFRLPGEDESVRGVPMPAARAYLRVAHAQIETWMRRRELPYDPESWAPLSDAWWEHVRGLMRFAIRLGPTQVAQGADPQAEIEVLYLTQVRPTVDTRTVDDLRPGIAPPPGSNGMEFVRGKWPGDESAEALLDALERMG